jgi:hypothetical protein
LALFWGELSMHSMIESQTNLAQSMLSGSPAR